MFSDRWFPCNEFEPAADFVPQYCTPFPKDLPNMGAKERGLAETAAPKLALPSGASTSSFSTPCISVQSTSSSSSPLGASPEEIQAQQQQQETPAAPLPVVNQNLNGRVEESRNNPQTGWPAIWGQILWEKWRWGVLIAVAVIVSRFSSTA